MRRIGLVFAGALLATALTGCGSSNTTTDGGSSGEFDVVKVTVNGKQVTCISWSDYKKGGLSCDWANAK